MRAEAARSCHPCAQQMRSPRWGPARLLRPAMRGASAAARACHGRTRHPQRPRARPLCRAASAAAVTRGQRIRHQSRRQPRRDQRAPRSARQWLAAQHQLLPSAWWARRCARLQGGAALWWAPSQCSARAPAAPARTAQCPPRAQMRGPAGRRGGAGGGCEGCAGGPEPGTVNSTRPSRPCHARVQPAPSHLVDGDAVLLHEHVPVARRKPRVPPQQLQLPRAQLLQVRLLLRLDDARHGRG